jgi:hypothetical protein
MSDLEEVYCVVRYIHPDTPTGTTVVFIAQSIDYYCAEIKLRASQYNGAVISSVTTTNEKKDYEKLGYVERSRFENISLPVPRLWTAENLSYDEDNQSFGVLYKQPNAKNARMKK